MLSFNSFWNTIHTWIPFFADYTTIEDWAVENAHGAVADGLEQYVIQMLFDELGISPYLKTADACIRGNVPFLYTETGWNQGKLIIILFQQDC